jgi:hypothetical protein
MSKIRGLSKIIKISYVDSIAVLCNKQVLVDYEGDRFIILFTFITPKFQTKDVCITPELKA